MATYCWDGESTAVKVNWAQKTYGVGEFFRERGGTGGHCYTQRRNMNELPERGQNPLGHSKSGCNLSVLFSLSQPFTFSTLLANSPQLQREANRQRAAGVDARSGEARDE